jgi:hypothetical protein
LGDVVNDLVAGIYQFEYAIGFTAEGTFNHTVGDALIEELDGSLQGVGAGSFRHLAEDLVHAASCATRVLVALIVMSILSLGFGGVRHRENASNFSAKNSAMSCRIAFYGAQSSSSRDCYAVRN